MYLLNSEQQQEIKKKKKTQPSVINNIFLSNTLNKLPSKKKMIWIILVLQY